jgi:hypothetical protein
VPLKLKAQERVLLGALALALVLVAVWTLRHRAAAPAALSRPNPTGPLEPIPRIDLARLDQPPPENRAGRRDLFAFGGPEDLSAGADGTRPAVTPPPIPPSPPPAAIDPATGLPVSMAPRPAPLNLKYIGSVESKAGVKVAVFVTDRNEVLTGQAGQVLANRYKIARIGLESVDLEEIGTGQSRRIPLRGS